MASKVVAGGQGWHFKWREDLLDWWGKWEKQISNFQPMKSIWARAMVTLYVPWKHLKTLYAVDMFVLAFFWHKKVMKSLWTGCVVFVGCSGIICALCMRVIHICSAMKTSLCLGCMGDSRKLLGMRHVAVFIQNKVASKCSFHHQWIVCGFWIHETSENCKNFEGQAECLPIQAAIRIRYMQNLAEDDIELERQRAMGLGMSFYRFKRASNIDHMIV